MAELKHILYVTCKASINFVFRNRLYLPTGIVEGCLTLKSDQNAEAGDIQVHHFFERENSSL